MNSLYEKKANGFFSIILLSSFLIVYLGSIAYEVVSSHADNMPLFILIAALFFISLIFGIIQSVKLYHHKRFDELNFQSAIFFCTVGASLTFILSIKFNLGPVIGASLVGVLGYYFCTLNEKWVHYPPAIYCGTFIGMSSVFIIPNIIITCIAAFFAGILYNITLNNDTLNGVGGKLGLIAFFGVTITVFLISLLGYFLGGLL